MKTTPFTDIHIALGAKMHEFAGYNMPIEYSGITDEHLTVRNGVGVFDVTHMGEFWIKGPNALDFLQRMTSNDVSKLPLMKGQYSCMPNGKGGIVDDIFVYRYENEKYFMVVNASNIEKDWNWLKSNIIQGVELENASERMALLAVQGPKAIDTLQKLTDIKLADIKGFCLAVGKMGGAKDVIISKTGYTGAGGFELYFYPEYGIQLWNDIFEAGKEFGIKPIGLGARDTLRLEKGYTLYGNDIDETTSPIEANLGWITKLIDGKELVDKYLLAKQIADGVTRKLISFEMQSQGIPRSNYDILNETNQIIGHVTSGSILPGTKTGIGMGYVQTEYSESNSRIFIQIRNKVVEAKVK
jgi:aminomethyltransferase